MIRLLELEVEKLKKKHPNIFVLKFLFLFMKSLSSVLMSMSTAFDHYLFIIFKI